MKFEGLGAGKADVGRSTNGGDTTEVGTVLGVFVISGPDCGDHNDVGFKVGPKFRAVGSDGDGLTAVGELVAAVDALGLLVVVGSSGIVTSEVG